MAFSSFLHLCTLMVVTVSDANCSPDSLPPFVHVRPLRRCFVRIQPAFGLFGGKGPHGNLSSSSVRPASPPRNQSPIQIRPPVPFLLCISPFMFSLVDCSSFVGPTIDQGADPTDISEYKACSELKFEEFRPRIKPGTRKNPYRKQSD